MGKRTRTWIQLTASLVQNADFRGFFTGRINQGGGKNVCVPGLNCYSCPGAVGACPIGSLQNFLSSRPVRFPYYVVGLLLFFGALLGRAVCGFLCPFGFIQELLHKIPLPKRKLRDFPGDRQLRYLKYAVLLVMVVIMPLAMDWTPAFCKWLCPAGTLEGGIPLVAINGSRLNFAIGGLYWWKIIVLAAVLAACLFIYRPFCKYLCPLGAIYGLMNKASLYRMRPETEKCARCGKCAALCQMGVDPSKKPNSAECIRCGDCVRGCPTGALRLGFRKKDAAK